MPMPMPIYEHRTPSPNLTSQDFFPFLALKNPDGYRPYKAEKKNVEPGEFCPERLEKLAAAVVSLKNATPEGLEETISLLRECDKRNNDYTPARLLIYDCNLDELYFIRSYLDLDSESFEVLNQFINKRIEKLPENTKEEIIKTTKDLVEFARYMETYEDILNTPNYFLVAQEKLNPHDSPDLTFRDSTGVEHYSFEGIDFDEEDLGSYHSCIWGSRGSWRSQQWDRINPVSKRTIYADKKETLKNMVAGLNKICLSFVFDKIELNADLFSGNNRDMLTRFPFSFLMEKAFDYPDKTFGFKFAEKVMKSVSQLCDKGMVNGNYLFNQTANSLLCKEKFWRSASLEWRNLLINNDTYPLDEILSRKFSALPTRRNPFFLACLFSPYSQDVKTLINLGANPSQISWGDDSEGEACEWAKEIHEHISEANALNSMLFKSTQVENLNKKLKHLLKDTDVFSSNQLKDALELANAKVALPNYLLKKLMRRPAPPSYGLWDRPRSDYQFYQS